jgi:N-acetylglucosaminyl-diphospho-decaprenol L-rhamnosyltransferase
LTAAVCVVVVTYNSCNCVQECARAVRAFFGEHGFRLIVVDNASTDRTLSELQASGVACEVIANDWNMGFAAAVNRGLQAADSEVVLLLNPDVSAIEGDPASVEQIFSSDSRIAAVAGVMKLEGGEIDRSCSTFPSILTWWSDALGLAGLLPQWEWARRHRMLDWDMTSEREVQAACGGFLFVRAEAIKEIGHLDERYFMYWEETDWLRRARTQGWRTVYTPTVTCNHLVRGSSTYHPDLLPSYHLESGYKYMRKHFGVAYEYAARAGFVAIDGAKFLKHLFIAEGSIRTTRILTDLHRLRIHMGLQGGKRRLRSGQSCRTVFDDPDEASAGRKA